MSLISLQFYRVMENVVEISDRDLWACRRAFQAYFRNQLVLLLNKLLVFLHRGNLLQQSWSQDLGISQKQQGNDGGYLNIDAR